MAEAQPPDWRPAAQRASTAAFRGQSATSLHQASCAGGRVVQRRLRDFFNVWQLPSRGVSASASAFELRMLRIVRRRVADRVALPP